MRDSDSPAVIPAILIAAALTLAVNLLRLVGELLGWAPAIFATAAGGGGSPLGITWLALVFGFWFGRRLARRGHRPRSTARALLLPLLGFAVVAGTILLLIGDPDTDPLTAEQWRVRGPIANVVGATAGLLTLAAWPRAWLALVAYGILARAPVVVIQYFAVTNGWDTHFAKGPPGMPEEMYLAALTLAQCTVWPFGWTPLAGGFAAALGALTVRRT